MKQLEIYHTSFSWLIQFSKKTILLKSSGHCLHNPFERHGRKKIKIMRERRFGWGENKEFGAICGQTMKDWKMEGTLYSLFLTLVFVSHVLRLEGRKSTLAHDFRKLKKLFPFRFRIFHTTYMYLHLPRYNFAHLT